MKRILCFCLVLGVGVWVGRMSASFPQTAAAGRGQGDGVEPCASENGDVNADGARDLSDAITILGYLFLGRPTELLPLCAAPPALSGLPDTGQTTCYGLTVAQGWVPVPCAEDATCPGQDGHYATGCPSEGRFVDNRDGTVTDTCTGLMWQQNTADVNGDGQLTDRDAVPWCDALAYCENLTFAGHDDWRLPNVRELQSIVDYGRFNPAIDPVFGAFSDSYWSSTSYALNPGSAWVVFFTGGSNNNTDVDTPPVMGRAVRSGP